MTVSAKEMGKWNPLDRYICREEAFAFLMNHPLPMSMKQALEEGLLDPLLQLPLHQVGTESEFSEKQEDRRLGGLMTLETYVALSILRAALPLNDTLPAWLNVAFESLKDSTRVSLSGIKKELAVYLIRDSNEHLYALKGHLDFSGEMVVALFKKAHAIGGNPASFVISSLNVLVEQGSFNPSNDKAFGKLVDWSKGLKNQSVQVSLTVFKEAHDLNVEVSKNNLVKNAQKSRL